MFNHLNIVYDKYEDISINNLCDNFRAKPKKKIVGRGYASGKGKTSGRGHKGQGQRITKKDAKFEGGQTPLHRRIPKFGANKVNQDR